MLLPNPKDATHNAWLARVLTALIDDNAIAPALAFKGGTCAAMRGVLDRFSIDLDFDFVGDASAIGTVRSAMAVLFRALGMTVKDESKRMPQFFLRYPVHTPGRSSMKIDVTVPPPRTNEYEVVRLTEIDRMVRCQTIETMVANKLVALVERYEKRGVIAGRDVYDVHHFFLRGFRYNAAVIRERRDVDSIDFFADLIRFVERRVTQRIIDEDVNVLLAPDVFRRIRTVLKEETIRFLRDEHARLRVNHRASALTR